MVIAICEMKEEDTEAQILFWESLNNVMQEEGFPAADFAGFMADEAGANWMAIIQWKCNKYHGRSRAFMSFSLGAESS